MVVPVGDSAYPLELDLAAGLWSIDVSLPSGGSIQEDFEVVADQRSLCRWTCAPGLSAQKHLSWAHFAGAVPDRVLLPSDPESIGRLHPEGTYLPSIIGMNLFGIAGNSLRGLRNHLRNFADPVSLLEDLLVSPIASQIGSGAAREVIAEAVRDLLSKESVTEPEHISFYDIAEDAGGRFWRLVAEADGSLESFIPLHLNEQRHEAPRDIYRIFDVENADADPRQRRWAYIEAFGERRLLSIPAPWPETRGDWLAQDGNRRSPDRGRPRTGAASGQGRGGERDVGLFDQPASGRRIGDRRSGQAMALL